MAFLLSGWAVGRRGVCGYMSPTARMAVSMLRGALTARSHDGSAPGKGEPQGALSWGSLIGHGVGWGCVPSQARNIFSFRRRRELPLW